MTCNQIIAELKQTGNDNTKRIYMNHGAAEPVFGNTIAALKILQKKIKKNHPLSLQLYNTGIFEAQYLAGLIADEKLISKEELQQWVINANGYMCSETAVSTVAAESNFGYELGMEWIKSNKEPIQAAGWSTLAHLVSVKNDNDLEVEHLQILLKYIEQNIHTALNRTRYAMNGFVISVGCFIKELSAEAHTIGEKIGHLTVDMGATACKVPYAPDYIDKVKDRGILGRKKKTARC